LTPFERLQFWESRPGSANQIVAVLDFAGRFQAQLFQEALYLVLQRHPLLVSRLAMQRGRPRAFYWPQPAEEISNWGQEFIYWQPQNANWQPGALEKLPDVHPASGPACAMTVQYNESYCRWIMQTHHMASDGVGGLQAIREVLRVYHWLASSRQGDFPLRDLNDRLLRSRGRARWFHGSALWRLPMKWVGLFGASKFLLRNPVSLERPNADSATDGPLVFVEARLSRSQAARLRSVARNQGVTVNSLLLAYWLIALDRQRQEQVGGSLKSYFRLIVPTNLRRGRDIALPACNQVSLVYVDRRADQLEHPEGLAAGIDYEMSVIRRLGLADTFLVALGALDWIPGMLRRCAGRRWGWATSYVTNLGPLLDRLHTPVDEAGQSQVGDLTLTDIRLLPPLRAGIPVALAVCQYARSLRFTLHYRPSTISDRQAQQLLQHFENCLKTL